MTIALPALARGLLPRDRDFVLQKVQPALLGLMDGLVSTLAPLFAAAARLDDLPLDIRHAAHDDYHQAAGRGRGVGPRLAQRPEHRTCVLDALLDDEQVEDRACQPVASGHRHHVPRLQPTQHEGELLAVGLRPADLLLNDRTAPGGAELVELRGEGLAYGRDAGVAEGAGGAFEHSFRR